MGREELLTVEEVADYLKVNQQTVRNWIDLGALRAVRVGRRRVRIRQSDLDAFLAAGTPAPSDTSGRDPVSAGWSEFGAAMSSATATLERQDREALIEALESLARATRQLAKVLKSP